MRDPSQAPEIDLHGLTTEQALRRLAQGLHAARLRGGGRVVVVTGRGRGSPKGRPVLRPAVEAWLAGAEGQRAGVRGFDRAQRGGALWVRLSGPGA